MYRTCRQVFTSPKAGFTLIELMVVIAVIGILSSVVLASLNNARAKAKRAKALDEMQQITLGIESARSATGKVLKDITGNGWSASGCYDTGPVGRQIANIATTDACYSTMFTSLSAVNTASGDVLQGFITNGNRDPWGSPYYWDENEAEVPTDLCRIDTLNSAGPDGLVGSSDDLVKSIPFSLQQCVFGH